MYFDNGSVKFCQQLRDSFTVTIELMRTKDGWKLVRTDFCDFPHGIAAQGEKTRDAAKTMTLAMEHKDRSTRLFVEHLSGLVRNTCCRH
jgi:hypothetical protein